MKNFLIPCKFNISNEQVIHFFKNYSIEEIKAAIFSSAVEKKFANKVHGPYLIHEILLQMGSVSEAESYFSPLNLSRPSEFVRKEDEEVVGMPQPSHEDQEFSFLRLEALNVANKVCGTCHYEYSGLSLPLNNMDHFSTFKASNGLYPDERIENNEMPPPGTRKTLVESLYNGGEKLLKADLKKLATYLKKLRNDSE